jgi:hypothetical protein
VNSSLQLDAASYISPHFSYHDTSPFPFLVSISVVVVFSFGIPFCLLLILIYLRKDIKELARLDKIEEGLKVAAKATFANFDIDGDGTISPTELRIAMAELGHALSEQECSALFVKMDTDGDGKISESEFTNIAVTFKAAESTMSKLAKLASIRGIAKGGVRRLRSLSRSRTPTTTTHTPVGEETKTAESKTRSADDDDEGETPQDMEAPHTTEHEKYNLRFANRLAVLYSIYKP